MQVVRQETPASDGRRFSLRGDQALDRLLQLRDVVTVLDIGSGAGEHARIMREAGRVVTTISLEPGADVVGDFMQWADARCDFDAIWACHVLEHQVDPGAFLRECRRRLRPGGYLVVTVPPLKHAIVGGHVTLWNAGLLLYQLILAGFNCCGARVGTYGYNISAIVPNVPADLPVLACDEGDIERLQQFFPFPASQGFDGRLVNIGWQDQPLMAIKAPAEDPAKAPRHVAVLGLGPSVDVFLNLTKRMGGRSALFDEVWGINAIGDVIACDRIFHMDDVRIQEIRAKAQPESNIAVMLEWLRKHPGPIYTSRPHPDYPGMEAYPLAGVVAETGYAYFNSTAAYLIAFAIYKGVKKITAFGFDFTYPNAHDAEKGRACVEFWLGFAAARGIELAVPKTTTLMDACVPEEEKPYGYDTLKVEFTRDADGKLKTAFSLREGPLPTAEEIEHRYDHKRHPSLLVEQDAQQAG